MTHAPTERHSPACSMSACNGAWAERLQQNDSTPSCRGVHGAAGGLCTEPALPVAEVLLKITDGAVDADGLLVDVGTLEDVASLRSAELASVA